MVTKYHFFVIDFDSWCLFGFSFILPIFVCWSEILDQEEKKEKKSLQMKKYKHNFYNANFTPFKYAKKVLELTNNFRK